jgi:hypothetical protein
MVLDENTGATKYDVIDGKQRLTTIIDFINGIITLPDDFGEGTFGNDKLNGLDFKELDQYSDYKKQFWKYKIPIIYIDSSDDEVIRNVFDRLNRNGEPLTPQELRNAKYCETKLYKIIDSLSGMGYWKSMLSGLEVARMEDKEFISELIFVLLEKSIISYSKLDLDLLYDNWTKTDINEMELIDLFTKVTNYIENLHIDYTKYKISGVSHLYAIWAISYLCVIQNIDIMKVEVVLNDFYSKLRNKDNYEEIRDYSKSMNAATKNKSNRNKRVNAIANYMRKTGIEINNIL